MPSADRKRIIVAAILPGAPAQATGLAALDTILKINGRSAAALGLNTVQRLLSIWTGHATLTVLVQSSSKKPRTLTVRLYDPLL